MSALDRLKSWAAHIKRDALTLWFCARHPRTPLAPKLLAVALAAYAFSPIDFIPDFIPVLGLLDEAVLLPLGIALCIRLVPAEVLAECRQRATQWMEQRHPRPRSYAAAAFILMVWAAAAWACWRLLAP